MQIDIESAVPARISVRDNAAGIGRADFPRAFRPAAIPPDRSGLAEFVRNSLMWAHYADNHRGVCLLYHIPDEFLYERSTRVLGWDKVRYSDTALRDFLLSWALKPQGSFDEFGIALIQRALTVKARPWEYEQEGRILRVTDGAESLDKRFLRQVCFGLRTPERDVSRLRELVSNCNYDVVLCKMIRDKSSDFGIEAIEI